jgi:hypothetical protein
VMRWEEAALQRSRGMDGAAMAAGEQRWDRGGAEIRAFGQSDGRVAVAQGTNCMQRVRVYVAFLGRHTAATI